MRKLVLFAISMMVCTFAAGQALTLADVKTKDAVQLSADDLKHLLPGAKVVTKTATGSTRNWENGPGETLSHQQTVAEAQLRAIGRCPRPDTAPGKSTTREPIAWPSSGV